jgi:hypothetical protein
MRANAQKLAQPKAAAPALRVVGKDEPAVKKLNLGGLAAKSSAKKSKEHPIMPVSAESLELLEQFLQVEPRYKELEKQSKSLKAQIAPSIKGDYFAHYAGSAASDSTQIAQVNGSRVRLVFSTKYTSLCTDFKPLLAAVGERLVADLFTEATELKIELDKIADEKQQPFIDAVLAAAEKLGISEGITAKQFIKPLPGFHESRTRLLTLDQNLSVDSALPMSAYAKLEK